MKKMLIALALCSISFTALSVEHNVFCRDGKIVIDSRSAEKMKTDTAGNAIFIKSFNFRLDAEKFAKTLGGEGAKCNKK
jgi:hypothetical protein